jgi:hypothetical protein
MSTVARSPLLFVLLIATTVAGCRTRKPSSIERWSACLVEHGHIERTGDQVEIGAGPTPTLFLHVRWGESPFVTEYTWGSLMAELSGGLASGATTPFASGAPRASYREGGQILVFDTDRLEGTVRVVRADARSAVLDVDLAAGWPRVDLDKRGVVPARGTITAKLVASPRECW